MHCSVASQDENKLRVSLRPHRQAVEGIHEVILWGKGKETIQVHTTVTGCGAQENSDAGRGV